MTDHDALLAAVLAQPDADLPRLIYADWLEETGHPVHTARAAFIRHQIEAENHSLSRAERATFHRVAQEIWNAHQANWLLQLPDWVSWQDTKVRYQRGFIHELITTPRRLFRDGHSLFDLEPVTSVCLRPQRHFSDRTPGMFDNHPYHARIRSLRLGPRLLHVAPLTGANRDPLDISFLTIARQLTGLQILDVSDNDLTDDWLIRFVHRFPLMAFASELRVLNLEHNHITDAGAHTLAAVSGFDHVQILLTGNRIRPESAQILHNRFGQNVVL